MVTYGSVGNVWRKCANKIQRVEIYNYCMEIEAWIHEKQILNVGLCGSKTLEWLKLESFCKVDTQLEFYTPKSCLFCVEWVKI